MVSALISIPGYHITEELYKGSRTLVYRGYRETNSLPVVIKLLKNRYPSFSELVQFRNQYTIAKNLTSPLIIQTYSLEVYQNGYALVMEDFGGISIKDYFTSVEKLQITFLQELLRILISLCDALDILHRNCIIHKDIKPANILINPETKQVKLIDFSIASLLPRETQEIQNANTLEGTLAYLSPEQTGRMNRGIDYRSDFYSLGVTFYELLTGQLPFISDDPMELVHCHLAKTPILVDQLIPEIPLVLSEIISKLIAKNAENRYQSALGIRYDLEICLSQLQAHGNIESFALGERDISDRFLIPEKLYGRETEVKELLAAFARVSAGNSEMVLVAGFSGIGKTAVVNEVHKPIVKQRGYFIKGKFDQFNRNIPFSAFVQAFRDLMGQLVVESDNQIQKWKSEIIHALGDNAQVIVDVIPELAGIIGQQPPATELSGSAAQNRFNSLFQNFLQVFASEGHPLVMFLDDLQWADSASLQLMQLLMSDANQGYLLLIGAYRDNEVSPAHPLMLTLDEITKVEAIVHTLTLQNLSQVKLNQLVADTLKCPENLALSLSQLIDRKTKGNPFFATQFLKSLHQDGLIEFNLLERCWQCDISQINQQALTDDVVEFMVWQLQKLSGSTQQVLKLAACIGNQFDLQTLAIISEQTEVETAACLWKALQSDLIFPQSDAYKFYQDIDEQTQLTISTAPIAKYKFLHDRVQQAAYSLIPDAQKPLTHLKIGLLLLQMPAEQQEEKIFAIANHLNIGREHLTNESEKLQLAQINLLAGQRAKAATANKAATEYFQFGLQMLPRDRWQNEYALSLKLYEEAAETASLSGDFVLMETCIQTVQTQAKTLLEQIKVYEVKIQAYTAQNRLEAAIQTALDVLKNWDVEFPTSPTPDDMQQAMAVIAQHLAGKDIASLMNLPPMTDAKKLAATRILSMVMSACYIGHPALYPLVVFKVVELSLVYGTSPSSAYAYATYGLIRCAFFSDIPGGNQAAELALQLLERDKLKAFSAKIINLVYPFSKTWQYPLQELLPPLLKGYQDGIETGDAEFAAYCAYNHCKLAYFGGFPLDEVVQKMQVYQEGIQALKQDTALNFHQIHYQSVLNWMGESSQPHQLIGAIYDETVRVPIHQAANDSYALGSFYLNKLILCYNFVAYNQAIETIAIAENYINATAGSCEFGLFPFYTCLTQFAVYPEATSTEQTTILEKVALHRAKLEEWAIHAPCNFAHRVSLVLAEQHRVLGQKLVAIELYDQATSEAKANAYIQEEALANELAAKFYLGWGKEKVAAGYMQEAYYCYAKWGAKAKTEDLEQRYPQLLQPILQQQRLKLNPLETIAFRGTSSSKHTSSTSISDALDFTSILKAAQAISSSIELDELLANFTRIILENAGAKKVVLLLPEDDIWQVRAITLIDESNSQTEIQTILKPQLLADCPDVPVQIIYYVKNTQQTIVINDGKTDIPGVIGEYMHRIEPQSVLSTPIINQGHLVGVLYLENNLTSGVFTSDRLNIISLLCTQAAISLENAQLYNHLQESKARFQRLADNAPGMIYQFQLSPDGISKFNYVSTGCYEIYEISPEQAVADANSLISATPPEDMAHYIESVTISAQTLEPWQYEGRIITSSGKEKWIQAASRPIKQADGTIIWDGLSLDITERKQAEAAVQQKSQELAKALQDLQQAQLQMIQSEKMSALGNLVAGVAHEMNNPLGFISASLQQAKPTIADIIEHLKLYQKSLIKPGDDIKDHAEKIDLDYSLEDLPKMINGMVIACDRLKNVSTSLRNFSRADKDYKVPFNIHQGIDSTILILKHRLIANKEHPAIEVITEYGKLPEVKCFPGQLNQVFMNIIANAIDALDDANKGRSFNEIQVNPNKIIVKTSVEDYQVKISIADNGKGMSEEIRQKIFDHLFTTKEVGKGTGLGLAIAQSIVVEKHNGSLFVNSTLGQGTEFVITLPILHH